MPNLSKDTLAFKVTIFESNHFDEVNLDNCEYFYPPEDPDDYRSDMVYNHDLVADIDADTLIRIVKFLKPQALITYTMRYRHHHVVVPSFNTEFYLLHTNWLHPNSWPISYPSYATET